MSAAASRYIRENFDSWELSRTAAQLLEVVGHYMNTAGWTALNDDKIAGRMKVSAPTIERARRELRAKGVLRVKPGLGRGKATEYTLPSTALKAITSDGFHDGKSHHWTREKPSSDARKAITGDGPRSLVVDPLRQPANWCDETCPSCHGVGWIEQRAANGDPINIAEPCPGRA